MRSRFIKVLLMCMPLLGALPANGCSFRALSSGLNVDVDDDADDDFFDDLDEFFDDLED